ncbi:MAG: heparan-alpha-glucosaminide N-acetyltransferase domain-containing protein [candidate division WOR-3 bacterium]
MKDKKRFLFLDLLRGIAVIEMINGHSLDALLSISQKSSLFYQTWMHVRGYTAPLFLFASGISFALSTIDRKEYLVFSEKLFTRIRRILFIILLGYTLHLPYFSLRKILLYSKFNDWNNFFNVDILQCIGVSLLILQFFYFITKKEKFFLITNFFLIFIFSILSFFINKGFEPDLPLFFYKYFKNSNFPLTPFSIYLFSGVFLGYLVIKKENKNFYFIIFALINFLIYLLLKPFTNFVASIYFKIFNLTLLSLILYQLENKENKFLNIIKILGMESLLVYYSHLLVVYGSAFNKTSLKSLFSGSLSFFEIYLIIFTLIFLFTFISLFWNYLKREKKNLSNVIKYSIYFYFLFNLLLRPY